MIFSHNTLEPISQRSCEVPSEAAEAKKKKTTTPTKPAKTSPKEAGTVPAAFLEHGISQQQLADDPTR